MFTDAGEKRLKGLRLVDSTYGEPRKIRRHQKSQRPKKEGKGKRESGAKTWELWHAAFTAQFHYVKQTSDGDGCAA